MKIGWITIQAFTRLLITTIKIGWCEIGSNFQLLPIHANARYLAHALIRECSISSECFILSRRRRNFFCSPCTTIGEKLLFCTFLNFFSSPCTTKRKNWF